MTSPAQEQPNPVHFTQHVEVLLADRVEAYERVAKELGGVVSVETIAVEGDSVVVDKNRMPYERGTNPRDKGDLVEVQKANGDVAPGVLRDSEIEAGAKRDLPDWKETIEVGEGRKAILLTRPATNSPTHLKATPGGIELSNFYEGTNRAYKRIRAEKRDQVQS